MLVAGKGLGEDVTYGAAARPVVAASEGRAREERERVREKGVPATGDYGKRE